MNGAPIKINKSKHNDIQIAIFNHIDGLIYATKNKLCPTNYVAELHNFNGYMLNNGEIHIRVLSTDFPLIKRIIV